MNYKLPSEKLSDLIEVLKDWGYKVIGPTLRENTIVISSIERISDLPRGYVDKQAPRRYRLEKVNNNTFFSYVVGPDSWKKYLYPPELVLFKVRLEGNGFILPNTDKTKELKESEKLAFLGIRSCDLHALEVMDRVLLQGDYPDPYYKNLRENSFFVAVNCTVAAETCFCSSLGTGPMASKGYDISLTEVFRENEHYFIARAGTHKGMKLLRSLSVQPTTDTDIAQERVLISQTIGMMKRSVDTHGLKDLLYGSYEDPVWDDVARRCLSCGNCTMVCPTCFCVTVEDHIDLGSKYGDPSAGTQAWRVRKWDSCFSVEYSYIHGGSIRVSTKSRYRQWLIHKFATWVDQFDTLGCIGCGRCITWCPAGIDVTEEIIKLRESIGAKSQTED